MDHSIEQFINCCHSVLVAANRTSSDSLHMHYDLCGFDTNNLLADRFFLPHVTDETCEVVNSVNWQISHCVLVVASGIQNKRQQIYADGSVSPINRRNMMHQDMIKQQQHQMDMIQQQRREDIYSSATSSPDTFFRPSSALRNSPTVYAVSVIVTTTSFQLFFNWLGFWSYCRLGWTPEVNFWEFLEQGILQAESLPVTQPTVSQHWRKYTVIMIIIVIFSFVVSSVVWVFDIIDWVTGRASGLWKRLLHQLLKVYFLGCGLSK